MGLIEAKKFPLLKGAKYDAPNNGKYQRCVRKDGFEVFFDLRPDPLEERLNFIRATAQPDVVILATVITRGLQVGMNYARKTKTKVKALDAFDSKLAALFSASPIRAKLLK
jgi:hypothetical protein